MVSAGMESSVPGDLGVVKNEKLLSGALQLIRQLSLHFTSPLPEFRVW